MRSSMQPTRHFWVAAECRTLGGCETGSAKITKGYRLPCRYVIHAVGPIWRDGKHQEKALLESCYRMSLQLAKEYACRSVAFPLISSGVYGYPKDQALKVAVDVISSFLLENEMMVYIVIFDRAAYQISGKLFADIAAYIDDRYVNEHTDSREEQRRRRGSAAELYPGKAMTLEERVASWRGEASEDGESMVAEPDPDACIREALEAPESPMVAEPESDACICESPAEPESPMMAEASLKSCRSLSLEEALGEIDESFSEMLLRKIDESGMTDAQCYKKANIDRKLFSKIRSDKFYKPSKPTVLAFALALKLPFDELQEMLAKAGFTLSHSSKFDIIVEYFVERGNYNVYEINEALFAFDQSLIGA